MRLRNPAEQHKLRTPVLAAARKIIFDALLERYKARPLRDLIIVHNGQGLKTDTRDASGEQAVYGSGGLVGKHSTALTTQPFIVIGRKGSAGKVTFASQGGWVTDTAYFAQPLDETVLDVAFLYHALAATDFDADIISTAIPGINRTAIYLHTIALPPLFIQQECSVFLNALEADLPLPELPPLPEQRRIVARVKGLLEKVEEARRLREEIISGYQQLLKSELGTIIKECEFLPLSAVAPIMKRVVEIEPRKYKEVGARSFGKGLFTKPDFSGSEISWQKPVWIKEGDLVLSNIKAWEGAIAPALSIHDGAIASHRYITCHPLSGVTNAEFLSFYLLTPEGLEHIGAASPGTADRNRTTGVKALGQIPVPVPSFPKQVAFAAMMHRLHRVQSEQTNSQPELDALPTSILAQAFTGAL